jgi:hypothetical protein
MTEVDWLVTDNPYPMLSYIRGGKVTERKVRLFNAAICRRFWSYLPEASKALLAESELIADERLPPPADSMELCGRANEVVAPYDRQYPKKDFPDANIRIQRDAAAAVCYAVIPGDLFGACAYFVEIDPVEKKAHTDIIRCIFGNPFRPVIVKPNWLISSVVSLAQAIYDERAFDRLPELADALVAAGCDNEDILNHCRSEGQHVRGCWAVDLVLGKE